MNITESPKAPEKTADVELKLKDRIANHRIPTKKSTIRPNFLNCKNTNAKSSIYQKTNTDEGQRFNLVDDVTKRFGFRLLFIQTIQATGFSIAHSKDKTTMRNEYSLTY
ncbi:hypothetical protein DPMN_113786 [Dreissena polymorpha]|uniref:Uncharacterized protein n=1 Tax=Dreissena polymorpha TaxID=45954 RepID=A0A9D4KIX4_DREPO|nr:hypothetical protein DPMN_113786 [Dreissena polymorpha]